MSPKNIKSQESQNKRWRDKNRWKARQISYRGTTKTFINDGYATNEDLHAIIKMAERKLKDNAKVFNNK